MTSSLVGSEMCIRDSKDVSGLTMSNACEFTGIALQVLEPNDRGSSKGPVSYTHLTLPTICSV
eukprot:10788181-Prorocentrum_lima.AAC.1